MMRSRNGLRILDALQNDGMPDLTLTAEGKSVTHTDFEFDMVLPNARRIVCVGVNFPDRNAEYKDGSEQPKYMSLFPRFASGFTGHDRPLIRPPESRNWIMKAKLQFLKPGDVVEVNVNTIGTLRNQIEDETQ